MSLIQKEIYISKLDIFCQIFIDKIALVLNGEQACPLACLKCNKVMVDFKDFIKHGPYFGSSIMFCKDDAEIFFKLHVKLNKAAKKENTKYGDIPNLYFEATRPYREASKEVLNELTSEEKNKKWVFLG